MLTLGVLGQNWHKDEEVVIVHGDDQAQASAQSILKGKRIVILPGHGGTKPGHKNPETGTHYKINGKIYYEKDITLQTGKVLKKVLQNHGVVVIMSREKDTYLSYKDQAIFADKHKPDIIISLHTNNAEDQDVSGIEIWGGKDCDDNLGDEIYRRFKQSKDFMTRLPRDGQFAVVKKTHYPAVLIEMGFYDDMLKMIQPVFQKKFSEELKEAFEEYFRKGAVGDCTKPKSKKTTLKKPQVRDPQVYDNRKTDLSRIARR